MAQTLVAIIQALGPWPSALLLLGAVIIICAAIVIIVLRSKIALDIGRDSKNKWRIRFVRIEEGGRIGDLPLLAEPDPVRPKRKPKAPDSSKSPDYL